MAGQLEGKTALITGGGIGIGEATALAMAAEGADVTVAGRTETTLADTVAQIKAAGGTARYVVCDVTDEEAVRNAVTVSSGDTRGLDIAVNSAGIDGGNFQFPTVDYPNETFEAMVATNVRGMFYSMKHELAQMTAQGHGALVNISSSAGLIANPGYIGYNASNTRAEHCHHSEMARVAWLAARAKYACGQFDNELDERGGAGCAGGKAGSREPLAQRGGADGFWADPPATARSAAAWRSRRCRDRRRSQPAHARGVTGSSCGPFLARCRTPARVGSPRESAGPGEIPQPRYALG